MEMSKVQKIVLLYTFWLSPVSLAKEVTWDAFTYERTMKEEIVFMINERILSETDDAYVDWSALEDFVQEQTELLRAAQSR